VAANSPVRTQGLARTGHTITTGDGNGEPLIAVRIDNGVLDGFPRAHAHGIVLRDNQINAQPLSGDQTGQEETL